MQKRRARPPKDGYMRGTWEVQAKCMGGDWEVNARYMRGTGQVQATSKRWKAEAKTFFVRLLYVLRNSGV
jgi:hypothetical protein